MKRWLLPGIITILSLLSLLTLSSIAPELASRQLIFFVLGFAAFFAATKLPFKRLQKLSFIAYIGLNILLLLTLIIGNVTNGSTRWIDIGGLFAIQGSQLAVPIVSLYLTTYFENRPLTKFRNIIQFIAITALPAFLIVIEPDLGTTIVYLLSVGIIFFFSKTRFLHTGPLIAFGSVLVIFAWLFFLQPYQKARITSFISPSDSQGASYNAQQSLIAVGSGQVFGRGLGQGIQSHLRFLPERQTDFVFASFAEEFGFLGAVLVITLYAVLIGSTLKTAETVSEYGPKFFCYTTAGMTAIQTGVNIGMNIGLLPITGITLPFFSYGGSSILTLLAMYGVVQHIRISQKHKVTLHLS